MTEHTNKMTLALGCVNAALLMVEEAEADDASGIIARVWLTEASGQLREAAASLRLALRKATTDGAK